MSSGQTDSLLYCSAMIVFSVGQRLIKAPVLIGRTAENK